ncbi:FeoA family protein [Paenibacillus sp. UNC499MF]|uniref:FeoA family protein n=1 Tax=Paenibacillus sp. UNC499MF TaxID=1502751 RepID=UPI0008A07D69|nr:FeoA family protein [Paenibacillus sp. UNC499MF]SEG07874.1 ferrous iron transport protein A [Paenibacillus sp. UNC499MF]
MSLSELSLDQVSVGSAVRLSRIEVQGGMRRRLLDLGFVPGNRVEVIQRSPLGDPTAFRVSNTTIALRKEESSLIYAEPEGGDSL